MLKRNKKLLKGSKKMVKGSKKGWREVKNAEAKVTLKAYHNFSFWEGGLCDPIKNHSQLFTLK